MILGQLIQTGRRFCECRSSDFIPKSEDTVVVIAYSIDDKFLAHSFDTDLLDLKGAIRTWLLQIKAVGYLLIRRKPHGLQREFPSPLGRHPMDQVTLTAATKEEFTVVSYYLEEISGLDSYRLVPAQARGAKSDSTRQNLFRLQEEKAEAAPRTLCFEFDGMAN